MCRSILFLWCLFCAVVVQAVPTVVEYAHYHKVVAELALEAYREEVVSEGKEVRDIEYRYFVAAGQKLEDIDLKGDSLILVESFGTEPIIIPDKLINSHWHIIISRVSSNPELQLIDTSGKRMRLPRELDDAPSESFVLFFNPACTNEFQELVNISNLTNVTVPGNTTGEPEHRSGTAGNIILVVVAVVFVVIPVAFLTGFVGYIGKRAICNYEP